ncbi:hypothetical protein BJ508DRAFT_302414 [Ascobolus immersus RN42]|uniref:Uncharacterized protein n=1 Tax=Ascobolus immersus RN42 TaxID=1160509 RepID=A0A3N4IIR9_ASCIM|nr:hypothetical protein BJ508DRAFT_302414 [Ascobolus immersus RN42]
MRNGTPNKQNTKAFFRPGTPITGNKHSIWSAGPNQLAPPPQPAHLPAFTKTASALQAELRIMDERSQRRANPMGPPAPPKTTTRMPTPNNQPNYAFEESETPPWPSSQRHSQHLAMQDSRPPPRNQGQGQMHRAPSRPVPSGLRPQPQQPGQQQPRDPPARNPPTQTPPRHDLYPAPSARVEPHVDPEAPRYLQPSPKQGPQRRQSVSAAAPVTPQRRQPPPPPFRGPPPQRIQEHQQTPTPRPTTRPPQHGTQSFPSPKQLPPLRPERKQLQPNTTYRQAKTSQNGNIQQNNGSGNVEHRGLASRVMSQGQRMSHPPLHQHTQTQHPGGPPRAPRQTVLQPREESVQFVSETLTHSSANTGRPPLELVKERQETHDVSRASAYQGRQGRAEAPEAVYQDSVRPSGQYQDEMESSHAAESMRRSSVPTQPRPRELISTNHTAQPTGRPIFQASHTAARNQQPNGRPQRRDPGRHLQNQEDVQAREYQEQYRRAQLQQSLQPNLDAPGRGLGKNEDTMRLGETEGYMEPVGYDGDADYYERHDMESSERLNADGKRKFDVYGEECGYDGTIIKKEKLGPTILIESDEEDGQQEYAGSDEHQLYRSKSNQQIDHGFRCFYSSNDHKREGQKIIFSENDADLHKSEYTPILETEETPCSIRIRKTTGKFIARPIIFVEGKMAGWVQTECRLLLGLCGLKHSVDGFCKWMYMEPYAEGNRYKIPHVIPGSCAVERLRKPDDLSSRLFFQLNPATPDSTSNVNPELLPTLSNMDNHTYPGSYDYGPGNVNGYIPQHGDNDYQNNEELYVSRGALPEGTQYPPTPPQRQNYVYQHISNAPVGYPRQTGIPHSDPQPTQHWGTRFGYGPSDPRGFYTDEIYEPLDPEGVPDARGNLEELSQVHGHIPEPLDSPPQTLDRTLLEQQGFTDDEIYEMELEEEHRRDQEEAEAGVEYQYNNNEDDFIDQAPAADEYGLQAQQFQEAEFYGDEYDQDYYDGLGEEQGEQNGFDGSFGGGIQERYSQQEDVYDEDIANRAQYDAYDGSGYGNNEDGQRFNHEIQSDDEWGYNEMGGGYEYGANGEQMDEYGVGNGQGNDGYGQGGEAYGQGGEAYGQGGEAYGYQEHQEPMGGWQQQHQPQHIQRRAQGIRYHNPVASKTIPFRDRADNTRQGIQRRQAYHPQDEQQYPQRSHPRAPQHPTRQAHPRQVQQQSTSTFLPLRVPDPNLDMGLPVSHKNEKKRYTRRQMGVIMGVGDENIRGLKKKIRTTFNSRYGYVFNKAITAFGEEEQANLVHTMWCEFHEEFGWNHDTCRKILVSLCEDGGRNWRSEQRAKGLLAPYEKPNIAVPSDPPQNLQSISQPHIPYTNDRRDNTTRPRHANQQQSQQPSTNLPAVIPERPTQQMQFSRAFIAGNSNRHQERISPSSQHLPDYYTSSPPLNHDRRPLDNRHHRNHGPHQQFSYQEPTPPSRTVYPAQITHATHPADFANHDQGGIDPRGQRSMHIQRSQPQYPDATHTHSGLFSPPVSERGHDGAKLHMHASPFRASVGPRSYLRSAPVQEDGYNTHHQQQVLPDRRQHQYRSSSSSQPGARPPQHNQLQNQLSPSSSSSSYLREPQPINPKPQQTQANIASNSSSSYFREPIAMGHANHQQPHAKSYASSSSLHNGNRNIQAPQQQQQDAPTSHENVKMPATTYASGNATTSDGYYTSDGANGLHLRMAQRSNQDSIPNRGSYKPKPVHLSSASTGSCIVVQPRRGQSAYIPASQAPQPPKKRTSPPRQGTAQYAISKPAAVTKRGARGGAATTVRGGAGRGIAASRGGVQAMGAGRGVRDGNGGIPAAAGQARGTGGGTRGGRGGNGRVRIAPTITRGGPSRPTMEQGTRMQDRLGNSELERLFEARNNGPSSMSFDGT